MTRNLVALVAGAVLGASAVALALAGSPTDWPWGPEMRPYAQIID